MQSKIPSSSEHGNNLYNGTLIMPNNKQQGIAQQRLAGFVANDLIWDNDPMNSVRIRCFIQSTPPHSSASLGLYVGSVETFYAEATPFYMASCDFVEYQHLKFDTIEQAKDAVERYARKGIERKWRRLLKTVQKFIDRHLALPSLESDNLDVTTNDAQQEIAI